METKTRRQVLLLGALLAVFGGVLWWNLSGGQRPAASGGATGRPAARGAGRLPAAPASEGPVDVALESLARPRPDPADGTRNPFRFTARAEPPPPASPPGPAGVGPNGNAGMPAAPPGPPPVPPIPLKFIGIVEQPAHRRLAALSDGRFTYYGREGDIIEGRYRIVRIGLESIEMVHVDGRGSQTIRLSGS